MTDLLKNQLGFNGVVVTDSMAMGALTGQKARTTRTLEAGADLVLIPPDPRASYEAILEKMKKDPAFANRVRDAVKRFQAVYVTYKLNKEVQPN
jgi:beta-glucosidase-like glycosyl hydrolase